MQAWPLRWISCLLVMSVISLLTLAAPGRAGEPGPWKPLFNGKDLNGWEPVKCELSSWHAEDGLLVCSGQGTGWLSTKDEFANFELELEFRVPPEGNSGVFIRAPQTGDPAYTGMEIQVLDDYADKYKDIHDWQFTGSLYDVVAPSSRVSRKAGEWQTMKIICDGPHVQVLLNGTQIIDAKTNEHPEKNEKHPGLTRTTGHIGLQNHGSRLEYRNLKVRELN